MSLFGEVVMKLKFIKVGLLAVLAGLLTPIAVMAIAHSDIFGCNGCHTPHNAKALPGVPLWNGSETTATFTMYSSDTFQGIMDGQPSGDSKLCLSCHDGANPDFAWMNPEHTFEGDKLASSHPISFVYDSALATLDGALKDPSQASTLGGTVLEDLLDPQSKMQCSSCHDIHSSGVGQSSLRGYDYGSQHGPELCRMCHIK
jgi:nitrate/TMAO reductase-like tetraheme cytochrome c subunit